MASHLRLLVIGADPGKEAAFADLTRAGLHVTLVTDTTDAYATLVNSVIYHSLDKAESLIPKLTDPYDGVLTLRDDCQVQAALVASILGLPSSGLEAAQAASSKWEQRRLMKLFGLPCPEFLCVSNVSTLENFLEQRRRPIVLKPLSSSASNAVSMITAASDATEAMARVERVTGSADAIAEDFLPGREVSVEAAFRQGSVYAHSVTEKTTSSVHIGVEIKHIVKSAQDQSMHARGGVEIAHVINALSASSGVAHAEFKVSDGVWTLIEIAFRIAGGSIPQITLLAGGLNLHRAAAEQAIGQPIDGFLPPNTVPGSIACSQFVARGGLVRRTLDPVEVADGLSHVVRIQQLVPAGRRVRRPLANWGRAAMVTSAGSIEDEADILNDSNRAIARLEEQLFGSEV